MFVLSYLFLFGYCLGAQQRDTGCVIRIKDLSIQSPLLVNERTKNLVYPEREGSSIVLASNDKIGLSCPGSKIGIVGLNDKEHVQARCVSKNKFAAAQTDFNINHVKCSSVMNSFATYTKNKCGRIGKEIEVGFTIENSRRLLLMIVCLNDNKRNVLYTHFTLSKYISHQASGGTRPRWLEASFYNLGVAVETLYQRKVQRATINRQLGLTDTDTKYVKDTGNNYLAKGHLTAKADFLYNGQQMQTFYYVNSVPQWQTFNSGNWFYLERNLRNYAANNAVDLEVYTGTYGICTLPHMKTGKQVELYFIIDDNDKRAIPIPKLLWKVAYDPVKQAGIAVFGVNNPYQTDVKKSIICDDIADKVSWLSFDRRNIKAGYMYACTIADFETWIPNILNFSAKNILK